MAIGSEIKETVINRPYAIILGTWDYLLKADKVVAARPKATELGKIGRVFGETHAEGPIRRSGLPYLTSEELRLDRCTTKGSQNYQFLGNGYSKIVFTTICDSHLVYKYSPGDDYTCGKSPNASGQNILEIAMHQQLQADAISGKNADIRHFAYMYAAYKTKGIIIAEKSHNGFVASLWDCMEECNNLNKNWKYDKIWVEKQLNPILEKYDLRDVLRNGGNCGIRLNAGMNPTYSPIVLDYGLKTDM